MKTKYMIQRHSDGLFSAGGASSPNFTENGKVWTSLRALHGHFAQYKHSHAWPRPKYVLYQVPAAYKDCSVVEVEITTSNPITVLDYMGELNKEIQTKKKDVAQVKADRVRVDELRLLKQLKAKYGDAS